MLVWPLGSAAQQDPFSGKSERLWQVVARRPRAGTALELLIELYTDAGKRERLLPDARQRIAQAPEDGRLRSLAGLLAERLGEQAEAIEQYQVASQLAEGDYYPLYRLGLLHLRRQDYAAASAALSESLRRGPPRNERLAIAHRLAAALRLQGKRDDAAEVYRQLATQFAGDRRVLTQLAGTLQAEGLTDEAISVWQRLERLSANDPTAAFDARLHVAQLLLDTGESEQAISRLSQLADHVRPGSWRERQLIDRLQRALVTARGPQGVVAFWQSRVERQPNDFAARRFLAESLARAGSSEEALRHYQWVLEHAPSDRHVQRSFLQLLIESGNSQQAIEHLRDLTEREPGVADWWQMLGQLYLDRAAGRDAQQADAFTWQQQQVVDTWQHVVDLHEADPDTRLQVGQWCQQAAERLGDATLSDPAAIYTKAMLQEFRPLLDAAEQYYRQAIGLAEGAIRYRSALAVLLQREGRGAEAIAQWTYLARQHKTDPQQWLEAARTLAQYGHRQAARNAVDRAADLEPLTVSEKRQLVELYLQLDEPDRAVAIAQEIHREAVAGEETERISPRAREAIELLAKTIQSTHKTAEWVKRLREKTDRDWRDDWLLASIQQISGDAEAALQAIQQALHQRPDDPALIRQEAAILEQLDKVPEAMERYRRLVQRQPDQRRHDYQRLLDLALRQDDVRTAEQAARKLAQLAPRDPEVHLLLATIAARRGDGEAELVALQRAVQVAPHDLATRRQLATVYRELGQNKEALELAYECLHQADTLEQKQSILAWMLQWASSDQHPWLLEQLRLDRFRQPDARLAAWVLAEALVRTGRRDEALDVLAELQRRDPLDRQVLERMTEVATQANRLSLAIDYQRQLVTRWPSPARWEELARLYRLAGQTDQAIAIWDRLLANDLPESEIVATVDRLLTEQDLFQAQRFVESGLARFPDSGRLAYRSGVLYVALDQPDQANLILRRVVSDPRLTFATDRANTASAGVTPPTSRPAYRPIVVAMEAFSRFADYQFRHRQYGARDRRALPRLLAPEILNAGYFDDEQAIRIYAGMLLASTRNRQETSTLASETAAWLANLCDGAETSQLTLHIVRLAGWLHDNAWLGQRADDTLVARFPNDPLPYILRLLQFPDAAQSSSWPMPADVTAAFGWLTDHHPDVAADMSALLAAQLYYHPDNAAVRQWLDQQWGDANDLPALDRVLPVVYRFANDEQVDQQFVMAITRAANRLASHTQSPADNQRAPTSMVALRRLLLAAADRIDWTDKQQRSAVETLTVFFVTGDAPSPQNISGASSRSQPGSRLLDTFRKMVQRETDHLRLSLRGTMPTTQRAALDARRLRWQQIYRQLAVPLALDWSTLLSPRPRSEPLVGQSAGEMETLFPAANRFVRDVGALRRVATRAAAHNQGQSLADRLHSAAGAWQPNGSPIRDKGPEDRRIAENGPLAVQAISLDVASSFVRWWSEDQRQAMEQLRSIAVTGDTQMEIRLLLIRAKAERGEMVEAWALISGQRQGPFAAQVAELERRVARRWANAARERSLIAHQGTVTALAFHPQGTLLASAGVDRSVRLWNPSTGTPLFSLDGHNDIVLTLAFSPDGKLLASAGYDRTIRLWDSQSAQSVAHWPAHEGAIRALRFLPDSRHLVSAGDDGSIRLWTLPLADTGSASPNMRQLAHLPTPGVSLAIDGSGDRLAVTTAAGGALVWQGLSGDVQAWQLTTLPAIPGASLRQLLFLPDQAGILAIADGQIAFRWHQDASGSWQRQELPLPASIRSIALVPPGNHVAMGGTDGRLRVWDWQSQKELAAVAAHPRKVLAVAVDPQKGRIASAGFDGTVQLWHAELGKARARKEAGQDSSE